MNKRYVLIGAGLTALGALGGFAVKALADGIPSPNPLYYSGTLTENGIPVSGTRAITIYLWLNASPTTGETALCTTIVTGTPVISGRFRIALDGGCKGAINSNSNIYVEVVDNGTSLGRSPVGALPYAVEADHAVNATNATNATTAATANAAGGTLATTLSGLQTSQSNVVDLTTSQTIAGAKTFATLTVSGNASVANSFSVGGVASVGFHVSSNCTYLTNGTSRCTCGTNEVALSGGGYVNPGTAGWFHGTNSVAPNILDVGCADSSGNRIQCNGVYVVCARLGL
jgi:hypothetical protein